MTNVFDLKRNEAPGGGSLGPRGADLEGLKLAEDAGMRVIQKTVRPGHTVVNAGGAFDGIYMVMSGFFKSSFIDSDGELQVTGFYFPRDIFGIEGIETGRYKDTVEALETGSICRIPLSLAQQVTKTPRASSGSKASRDRPTAMPDSGGMLTLIRIMSRAIGRDRNMIFALGRMGSKRRFAAFLLDLSERMTYAGYNGREFRLCMSRTDMSNYLCLAVETISRLFSRFQSAGIISVHRRQLKIRDMDALRALAGEQRAQRQYLEKAS